MKLAPDARTPRQQAAEDARRLSRAEELAKGAETKDSLGAIRRDVLAEAVAGGQPEAEAARAAAEVADTFRAWGEKVGIDPFALYRAKKEILGTQPPELGLVRPEQAANVAGVQGDAATVALHYTPTETVAEENQKLRVARAMQQLKL